MLGIVAGGLCFVAADGFGAGRLALFAAFVFFVGPLLLFDFTPPLLKGVLILGHGFLSSCYRVVLLMRVETSGAFQPDRLLMPYRDRSGVAATADVRLPGRFLSATEGVEMF
jgi:hypothetical protein